MKILISIVAVVSVVVLSPYAYNFFWSAKGYLQPDIVEKGRERYRGQSVEYLIKKLNSISPYDRYTALDVLAERKEVAAVPQIIAFLKSHDDYQREAAMRALATINDSRAVEPLMKIVKSGSGNKDYETALLSLAEMQYKPIRPYVLDMLKENGVRSGAITMLRFVGTSEDVALLEKIYNDVRGDDVNAGLDRSEIAGAISEIKRRTTQ